MLAAAEHFRGFANLSVASALARPIAPDARLTATFFKTTGVTRSNRLQIRSNFRRAYSWRFGQVDGR
jgi:hypothetical protein